MEITFDQHKRLTNLAKHGYDFADLTLDWFEAARVVSRRDDRVLLVGEFRGEVVIAVVVRPLGTQGLSVISMRRASRKERSL